MVLNYLVRNCVVAYPMKRKVRFPGNTVKALQGAVEPDASQSVPALGTLVAELLDS